VIPFNHSHDADDPGLRDYRARVEDAWDWPPNDGAVSYWYRYALFVAVLAILAILALSLVGCAWNYPPNDGRLHLDAVHPSAERIAQLAETPHAASITQQGWLRLSSPFVLAGGAVRLTCVVPEHRDQRYLRLALADAVGPVRVITHAKTYDELLIESVPCGGYTASCDSLANSNRVLLHLEQPFVSRGSCNAEGDK